MQLGMNQNMNHHHEHWSYSVPYTSTSKPRLKMREKSGMRSFFQKTVWIYFWYSWQWKILLNQKQIFSGPSHHPLHKNNHTPQNPRICGQFEVPQNSEKSTIHLWFTQQMDNKFLFLAGVLSTFLSLTLLTLDSSLLPNFVHKKETNPVSEQSNVFGFL